MRDLANLNAADRAKIAPFLERLNKHKSRPQAAPVKRDGGR